MPILHYIYILIFLLLVVGSAYEIFIEKKKNKYFCIGVVILLIIATGFRVNVGPDYPIYRNLFVGFSLFTDYSEVLQKALFQQTDEEIEWLYVLLNKLIFDVGLPFYIVTLIMAIIAMSLKVKTMFQYLEYPVLGIFFYFMPVMFFEDSGQMRQGIGIAICVFSFRYIIKRNLLAFMVCIYIALSFHKTSIVFVPAYWIVKIPMNRIRIVLVLLVGVLISPFGVFKLFSGVMDFLTPSEVNSAYAGYIKDAGEGTILESGLNDVIKLGYIFLLVRYDKEACAKVPYYEYMRNLGVFGLFIFYIMRTNAIFAIRLPGVYMFFLIMFCMPSIVFAVKDTAKKTLYVIIMVYFSIMFFHFARISGDSLNFTIGKYKNVLWDGYE